MTDAPQWWTQHHHSDRQPILRSRMQIKSALRTAFEADGFQEIDSGCLQTSPGNERHLHAFKTHRISTKGNHQPFYLHTSPEFACKKLLAAGEDQLFTFASVFRNREASPLHANEFTLLEWYRTDVQLEAIINDCLRVLVKAGQTTGRSTVQWKSITCDLTTEPERLTVNDAFECHAGIDLISTLGCNPEICQPDRDALAKQAETAGIHSQPTETWSDIFSKVLTALVEPKLGHNRPTVLTDYPAPEAALAKTHTQDARLAQRFELYVCGIELANGFAELTDPVEQRARFQAEMDAKQAIYGERYPLDEDFLAALTHMPDACGVALGFDRLVMLATGAQRIDQVIWTPMPASD